MLAVSTLLIPYGTLALIFFRNPDWVDRLVWAGSLTMGLFSSVLILTLIRDLLLFVPALQAWSGESAVLVLALSVLVSLVGFVNARRVAKVVRVDIPLANLPAGLDGFTIAQISDIHVGSTIKGDYVRGIVDRVNGLGADAVAVTGNHEYYSSADEWLGEFRRLGLRPLTNEHVVVGHGGENLVIAGINDFNAAKVHAEHTSDPAAALAGSPPGLARVLLAHQPRSAPAAEEAGFDLQLSGHTHGGQFWPWNHFVKMQQPFTAGLHRLGHLWVYTSRGTGYWGPPKRFGAPSEITLITLRSAA